MIFLGVLGGDPLGEWGMAKTKTVVFLAEPRGKAFPLIFTLIDYSCPRPNNRSKIKKMLIKSKYNSKAQIMATFWNVSEPSL